MFREERERQKTVGETDKTDKQADKQGKREEMSN